MRSLDSLYALAEKRDIPIYHFPLPTVESMSLMDEGGRCCIGMDMTLLDTASAQRTHLAHELGHCLTGSFYNRYAPQDLRARHEVRADKWAVRKLIPRAALDDAIALGCTEYYELADHFGVSEAFLKKAICLYTYGNVAAELYF